MRGGESRLSTGKELIALMTTPPRYSQSHGELVSQPKHRLRTLITRLRPSRTAQTLTKSGILLVGNSPDLPEALADVVQTEGHTTRPADGPALSAWLFQDNQEPAEVDLDLAAESGLPENAFLWCDLSAYPAELLEQVALRLHLHRNAVRASLSPWHRPWLAVYVNQCFVSVTLPILNSTTHSIEASELDLFLGEQVLVSSHKQHVAFIEHVLARAHHQPELIHRNPAFLLYLMLDEALAYYERLYREIQAELEHLEDRALRDTEETFLADLLHFKRYAYAFSQLADQHREVFAALVRPDFVWVAGTDVESFFRDLDARFMRMISTLDGARDAIKGAFEIYISHMTHRTNQIIKVLTLVSTLLLPITVLIGLFGASIENVLPHYQSIWFFVMLLCIFGISGGILVIFRRQHWI